MPKYHYSLDGYLWHKLPCMREPNDNSVVFFTCSGAMSWLQHQMEFWIMKRQSDKMWVVRFWGTSIEYLSDTFSRWQRRSFVFLALCLYKSVRPFPAVGQFIIRLKTSLAIPPRVQFVRVVFICGHGVDSSFIHPLCWVCLGMTQDVWFLNKSVVLTFLVFRLVMARIPRGLFVVFRVDQFQWRFSCGEYLWKGFRMESSLFPLLGLRKWLSSHRD